MLCLSNLFLRRYRLLLFGQERIGLGDLLFQLFLFEVQQVALSTFSAFQIDLQALLL